MPSIALSVRDPVASSTRAFEQDEIQIGRAEDSDVVLADRTASRRHARFVHDEGQWWVEDMGSRAGTRRNGRPVALRERLSPGDQVAIGASVLVIDQLDGRGGPAAHQAASSGAVTPGTSVFLRADEIISGVRARDAGTSDTASLRKHAQRLEVLNEVHRALGASMALPELLELILDRAFQALQPEEGVIVLRDGPGRYRRASARRGPGSRGDALLSSTLHEEVIEKRQAALVCDLAADERFGRAASLQISGIRSLIAAPLYDDRGPLGMLALDSRAHVRSFTQDDLELLTSLASVAALRIRNVALAEEAAERHRLEEELKLARTIQIGLLPRELPMLAGWSFYAGSVPSRGVSGDYYFAAEREEGRNLFAMIVDVSGKGMAAALLTASLEALAASPIELGQSPGEIAPRVSKLLYRRTLPAKYATAFLIELAPATGRFRYVNAGHNPSLVVRANGTIERLGATGPPIGLLPEAAFEEATGELGPGDLLALYTDGIVEAADPDDDEFGIERLEAYLGEHRTDALDPLAEGLDVELERFARGVPFADDRTLVLLRRDA